MSTRTKLTQKVDHFTVFKSFPSCCSQKFAPNSLEKIGWLDVRGSIENVFIEWVVGDGLVGKSYSSKLWYGTNEAQKPAWRGCAGSLMAEMKHNLLRGCLGC